MIRPRPAVRAFAVAATLAVVGSGLAVAASSGGWHVAWVIVGLVVLLAGVALVGLAAAATRRQEVTIHLTDEGYRIVEPTGTRTGLWAEVSRVTGSPGRITLHQGPSERVVLAVPRERADELDSVATDIGRRLDNSRGYTNLA